MSFLDRLFGRGKKAEFETEGSKSREDLITEGFVACELAQYAKARACYAKVCELYPNDSFAWYNLSVVEYRAKNFKAAANAFTRVIGLKEHLVVGAYGQAKCLEQLGQTFKLPPEYTGDMDLFRVEAPMRNLAHELRNRGLNVAVVVQPEYSLCRVDVRVGSVTYKLSLQSFIMGLVSEGFYREEGGQEIHMSDPSVYPNPTQMDRNLLALKGKLSWIHLAQIPTDPPAMSGEKYIELQ